MNPITIERLHTKAVRRHRRRRLHRSVQSPETTQSLVKYELDQPDEEIAWKW